MYLSISIFIIVFIMLIISLSKTVQVQKLLNKKTKNQIEFELENNKNSTLSQIVYKLTTTYNYKLIRKNDNQYVISDKISFFSWGNYYLIENKDERINVYLVPKYLFEYNYLGKFGDRLQELKSHIELINSAI